MVFIVYSCDCIITYNKLQITQKNRWIESAVGLGLLPVCVIFFLIFIYKIAACCWWQITIDVCYLKVFEVKIPPQKKDKVVASGTVASKLATISRNAF